MADEEPESGDVAFSSLGQCSTSPRSGGEIKDYEECMNSLQANFRTLNCSTPRPNIEKSTEYVSAWLSECQNECVPDGDGSLMDYGNENVLSLTLPTINSTRQHKVETTGNSESAHPMRPESSVEKVPYHHYSKIHTKLINEPDPNNFFTSLAITNNEIYNPFENKPSTAFGASSKAVTDINNLPFGMPRFSNANGYQSTIIESDLEDEEDSNSPTEIMSFRPHVRVQRPISSRVRDHAITPIATGSYVQSAFGGRHGINVTKQVNTSTGFSNSNGGESYRSRGRLRLFDSLNDGSASATVKQEIGTGISRIKSGLTRQTHGLFCHPGKTKQQAWSRHSGDDLTADANYVTSLYENYPSIGFRTIEEGNDARTSPVIPNQDSLPSSAKDNLRYFDRSKGLHGSSVAECEDQSFKPIASWLMNR